MKWDSRRGYEEITLLTLNDGIVVMEGIKTEIKVEMETVECKYQFTSKPTIVLVHKLDGDFTSLSKEAISETQPYLKNSVTLPENKQEEFNEWKYDCTSKLDIVLEHESDSSSLSAEPGVISESASNVENPARAPQNNPDELRKLNRQQKRTRKKYMKKQCPVCSSFVLNLRPHMLTHTGEKPYQCKLCSESFVQRNLLRRHMFKHSGEKPHKCCFCDKKFIELHRLKIHLKTHSGEKPFECITCGKYFCRKEHLKRHSIIHFGQASKCSKCNKSFKNEYYLSRHEQVHKLNRKRSFVCATCDRCYFTKSALEVHIKFVHAEGRTGDITTRNAAPRRESHERYVESSEQLVSCQEEPKRFECFSCNKTFSSKKYLRTHVLHHSAEEQFRCPAT